MTVEERDPLLAAQGSIAMADLRELSVAAADLVTLCSFLAPDDIPRELLLRGAPALSEPLASALDGQLALIELAATIESYGLMRVDGDAFSMHRRIQSTVRDALDDDGRRQWVACAAGLVLAAFPDTPEDTRAWPWAARVVPHARRAIESLTEYDAEPVTRIRLLDLTGRFLTPQGQLDTARELLEAALEAVEQVQPDTMLHGSVLNHFAVLEREQGHFKDARRDARRALAIHRAALPSQSVDADQPDLSAPSSRNASVEAARGGVESEIPPHSEVADDLRNLGLIARQRGDLDEAFEHLDDTYKMRLQLVQEGASSLSVAEALVDLFGLAVELERRDDAIGLLARAIEILEAEYGPEDDEVVLNRGVLEILTAEDDLERRAREVLSRTQERYGARHPQTTDAVRLLATLLWNLGQVDEARRMAEHALQLGRDNYGPTHFRAGADLSDLFAFEARAGDTGRAFERLEELLEVVRAAPAEDQPATFRLSDLPRRLREVAAGEDGRSLIDRAEAIFDAAFADDSPVQAPVRAMIVGARLTAADILLHDHRGPEAREQYDRGLKVAELTLDNPLDDVDFHVRLGVMDLVDEDIPSAQGHFDVALSLLSDSGFSAPVWPFLSAAAVAFSFLGRPAAVRDAVDRIFDQAMEGPTMSTFRPRLVAPVPENWFVKESTTVLAPDGQANVIASSEPLDPTITLDRYAGIQGELLEKEFNGYREVAYEETTVLGDRSGMLRHFEWTPEGGAQVTQLQLYYVEDGRGYTATATTPSEHFPGRELVLRELLRGLRLAS